MRKAVFMALIALLLQALPARAASDALINIDSLPHASAGAMTLAPGLVVMLPDGRQATIESILPDGNFKSSLGDVISPMGILQNGPHAGKAVIPDEKSQATREVPTMIGEKVAEQEKKENGKIAPPTQPEVKKPQAAATPAAPAPPKPATSPASQHDLTLAELLPMTAIKPEKTTPAEEKKEVKKETKAEKVKGREKPEKATPPKKHAGAGKTAPRSRKAAPGEPLRIPHESVASGNLDFLEGCWQGTRPEYFSKRTVKECFCFGANGQNGKRRIFDRSYNRQCIGATRAHLSRDGVLSVTSQGAVCNDGERWGAAEMVCRNSGPRTPCSWVFRDANNGRQAYEIPFVRVEACGR